MGINIYNDQNNKFEKLIEDLKDLPKINAPDNFEFQLMTNIQNKNFGTMEEPREKFNIIKFFAPSAVVVTVIILFFIFLPANDQQYENLLMSDPPQIISQTDQSPSNEDLDNTAALSGQENYPPAEKRSLQSGSGELAVNPNDAVLSNNAKYPISRSRSVALDDFISGNKQKKSSLQQGNVVRGGESASEFDGFFIREELDAKTLQKYRATLDSIKKAEARADSLKRAKKTE